MMFWDDHNPPHYHAKYNQYKIIVEINSGVIKGKFPPRALRHLLEWHDLHKQELLANWKRAQKSEDLLAIEGLE